jgi:hypothetical protein
MPNSQKALGFSGCMVTLFGGISMGFGLGAIALTRLLAQRIADLNTNVAINSLVYGDLILIGSILIILGLLAFLIGIYIVFRSYKTPISFPPPP